MQKILTCELCYVLQECDHLRAVVERQKEEISRLREENMTLRAVMDKQHSSGENQTMFGGSLPSWENAWGYPTTMGERPADMAKFIYMAALSMDPITARHL